LNVYDIHTNREYNKALELKIRESEIEKESKRAELFNYTEINNNKPSNGLSESSEVITPMRRPTPTAAVGTKANDKKINPLNNMGSKRTMSTHTNNKSINYLDNHLKTTSSLYTIVNRNSSCF
jgi:hypothetical protein